MYGYENVSFMDRLPDDFIFQSAEIDRLAEIKNSIDKRLRALEEKLHISNLVYIKRLKKDETAPVHLKSGVYFSPFN